MRWNLGRLGNSAIRRGGSLLAVSLWAACCSTEPVPRAPNSVAAPFPALPSTRARSVHDAPVGSGLTASTATSSVASPDQESAQADALNPEEAALRNFVIASFRGEHLEASPCHQFVRLDHRRLVERGGATDESLRDAERAAAPQRDAKPIREDTLRLIQWLAGQYGLRALEARRNLAAAFALDRQPSASEQSRLMAIFRQSQSKAVEYLAVGGQREFRSWKQNDYLLGLHYYYSGQLAEARRAWLALLERENAPSPGRTPNLYAHIALGQSYLVKPMTDVSRAQAMIHFRKAYSALDSAPVHQQASAAAGCYVAELEAAAGNDVQALNILRRLTTVPSAQASGISAFARARADQLRASKRNQAHQ